MKILGIETSCDETAASIIRGSDLGVEVVSNIISSQIDIHKKYGGVVPEVAAREHVLNILPVVNEALKKADIKKEDAKKQISAIAVSIGPGLITSLMVGVETAKTLSYVWDIPIVNINHIEGHIAANFIGTKQIINNNKQNIKFPAIILTVSGGHTMLILMEKMGKYKTIGETRDDAAGEAFDKAAKMMHIDYPGGPAIADKATKFLISTRQRNTNNFQLTDKINFKKQFVSTNKHKKQISLPRPMIDSNNFDFSFSGLKTALFYELQKDKKWKNKIPEYCYEFQQAIIDVLISKTIKAVKKYNIKTIMLTGGVSANKELRKQMKNKVKQELPKITFKVPDLEYTTDNAAMIATAGYFKAKNKKFTSWQKLQVDCNLKL